MKNLYLVIFFLFLENPTSVYFTYFLISNNYYFERGTSPTNTYNNY